MGGFAEVRLAGELGGRSQWPSQESPAFCDLCLWRVYGGHPGNTEREDRDSGDGDSDKGIRQRAPGSIALRLTPSMPLPVEKLGER